MRSEKYQIKSSMKDRVWSSQEGKKEEKERKIRAHQRHVTFVIKKVIRRMTASTDKSS